MPQLFPDGPSAVNLSAMRESGGINVPNESTDEFDTPGMQGSMQQLLSENLGRYVMADFLIGVSSIVRRVGVLYSVGRGFLVLYDENFRTFDVCDIFSLKFIAFFPPGFEPSYEDILSGRYPSGILAPGINSNLAGENAFQTLFPTSSGRIQPNSSGSAGTGMTSRSSSGNGCRTLGQR